MWLFVWLLACSDVRAVPGCRVDGTPMVTLLEGGVGCESDASSTWEVQVSLDWVADEPYQAPARWCDEEGRCDVGWAAVTLFAEPREGRPVRGRWSIETEEDVHERRFSASWCGDWPTCE